MPFNSLEITRLNLTGFNRVDEVAGIVRDAAERFAEAQDVANTTKALIEGAILYPTGEIATFTAVPEKMDDKPSPSPVIIDVCSTSPDDKAKKGQKLEAPSDKARRHRDNRSMCTGFYKGTYYEDGVPVFVRTQEIKSKRRR